MDMRQEKKDKGFRLFSPLGCLLVVFLFLVLVGIGAGITFEKTGLIDVPVLGKVFKRQSEPVRRVANAGAFDMEKLFMAKVAPVMLQHMSDTAVSASFTEQEATTLIRGQLANMQTDSLKVRDAQVVFLDNAMELFVDIIKPRTTTLRAVIEPRVSVTQGVAVRVQEVELGSLGLPAPLLNVAIFLFLQKKIAELETMLLQSPIQQAQLRDGFVDIVFDMEKLKNLGN